MSRQSAARGPSSRAPSAAFASGWVPAAGSPATGLSSRRAVFGAAQSPPNAALAARQTRMAAGASPDRKPLSVLVTGASGRTGRLVLQTLVARPEHFARPRGLVRSVERATDAVGEGCLDTLVEGDVADLDGLQRAMHGVDAVVILTSAVPKMRVPTPAATAPVGGAQEQSQGAQQQPQQQQQQPPSFYFEENGTPEFVDWLGGKNQIDAARQADVKHVVLVGSMGATDLNHPLNRIANGNILRFKREAQRYLIDSGLDYTIINPGGLVNEDPGQREIIVGRNDDLLKIYQANVSIARADVAEIAVQSLLSEKARNKAFDVACKPKGEGHFSPDFDSLFSKTSSGL